MSSYNILFPSYTIGTDAYTKIPEICPTYGRKIAVIGGKTALSKARPAMEAALKDCPELQILDFIWYGGDSTLEHVEDMKKNPAVDATVPKAKKQEREIWTAEMLMQALEACDNKMLKIAFHLAFTATLRIGELLGLTWDDMDISEEAIADNKAYVICNKQVENI